jgi:dephospho-CoA kinase
MLFLTGVHGAGKTEAANIIKFENPETEIFDTGPILRNLYRESNTPLSTFGEWIKEGEKLEGLDFTNRLLKETILGGINFKKPLINKASPTIVGCRSMRAINYIDTNNPIIVYIETPIEVARERYNFRENKKLSFLEFNDLLEEEKKMGIDGIKSNATFTIENSGSIETFSDSLSQMLTLIGGNILSK